MTGLDGFSGDAMLQGDPVQKFHDDEWLTILLPDFMDGADIGMVQCGSGLRFALETGECLGVFGYFVGQKFQGYEAVKLDVLGLVHNAHPATAQLFNNAVVRDGLADHAQACYGASVGKSMRSVELAVSQNVVDAKSPGHSLICAGLRHD
jgi:hypothetical protein